MHDTASKGAQWWRWPVMPFAALGGAIVVSYVLTLLRYLIPIHPIISSSIFGGIFITIACSLAPTAKLKTGVIMALLLNALWILLAIFGWYSLSFTRTQAVMETWRAIGIAIGSSLVLVKMRHEKL